MAKQKCRHTSESNKAKNLLMSGRGTWKEKILKQIWEALHFLCFSPLTMYVFSSVHYPIFLVTLLKA